MAAPSCSVAGAKVGSAAQMWRIVADAPIGTSVKLGVRRADRVVTLTVPVVAATRRLPVRQ